MAFALLQIRTWLTFALPDRKDERGASIVEYALLLALIAMVCLVCVNVIGTPTRDGLNEARSSGWGP